MGELLAPCKVLPLKDWIERNEKPSTIKSALMLTHAKRAFCWQAEGLIRRLQWLNGRMGERKVLTLKPANAASPNESTTTPSGSAT